MIPYQNGTQSHHLVGLVVMVTEDNMKNQDQRRHSAYLDKGVYDEMVKESARLERPLSFVVQLAWKIARKPIMSARSFCEPVESKCHLLEEHDCDGDCHLTDGHNCNGEVVQTLTT